MPSEKIIRKFWKKYTVWNKLYKPFNENILKHLRQKYILCITTNIRILKFQWVFAKSSRRSPQFPYGYCTGGIELSGEHWHKLYFSKILRGIKLSAFDGQLKSEFPEIMRYGNLLANKTIFLWDMWAVALSSRNQRSWVSIRSNCGHKKSVIICNNV